MARIITFKICLTKCFLSYNLRKLLQDLRGLPDLYIQNITDTPSRVVQDPCGAVPTQIFSNISLYSRVKWRIIHTVRTTKVCMPTADGHIENQWAGLCYGNIEFAGLFITVIKYYPVLKWLDQSKTFSLYVSLFNCPSLLPDTSA